LAQGRSESVGFGYSEVGVWEYLTTQAWAVAHYARLSLWPDPLIFDYGVQPIVDPARWLAPGVLVIAALAWTVWGLVRRRGAAFLGAVWFVILAPSSSVLPIVTELVVEHRAYLPSAAVVVGVVLAVAALLERFVAARQARLVAGVVLTLAVGAAAVLATRARNRDYASEIGMWRDVLDKLPTNARAQASYGNDLVSAGREPDAGPHYAEAVRLHPQNGYWRANLGTWLMNNGKLDEAVAELERSREILPNYGMTLQNLGEAYSRRGESDKALELWQRALENGAPQPGGLAARVSPLLFGRKRDAEALAACRAAVRSAPNDPLALATLARALLQTSDTKLRDPVEAGGLALRAAMLKRGTDAELFELQADALVQHGRNGEAAGALRNAEAVWRAQSRVDRAEAAARRATALLAAANQSAPGNPAR
jgi:tetratricopeptide (TPR) repeat protein